MDYTQTALSEKPLVGTMNKMNLVNFADLKLFVILLKEVDIS